MTGAFVGRELLLRSLIRGLDVGRSFSIIGGPGMGRTSVLLRIREVLRERWARQPQAAKLIPVYLDAQHWPADVVGSMEVLGTSLREALFDPKILGADTPARPPERKEARSSDPLASFPADLRRLANELREVATWSPYVLLVDNIDPLTEPDRVGLLETLVDAVRGDSPGAPQAMVVSGGRLLRESLRERASPLKGMRMLSLHTLMDTEARSLIRRGFPRAKEHDIQFILASSGSHPWVLTSLLGALEKRRGAAEFRSVVWGDRARLVPLWERIWAELDMRRRVTYRGAYAAPEHALLQYAIDYRGPITIRTAERELAIRPLKEYADLLEYIGVAQVRLESDNPTLQVSCELFNQWYRERIKN
ncbi:MAG: hypothetical protein AAFP04_15855 [Myxococcota bacterium]